MDDVEITDGRCHGQIPALVHLLADLGGDGALGISQEASVEADEQVRELVEVLAGGVGNDVEVLSGTDVSVSRDRDAADDDATDARVSQPREQPAEVGNHQRGVSTGRMADSWAQSAWTRSSRSSGESWRSRSARIRRFSSASPTAADPPLP
ncbi:MAG: hypothetical protein ACRDPM_12755 [Solirubrobacteraceae bacterium]